MAFGFTKFLFLTFLTKSSIQTEVESECSRLTFIYQLMERIIKVEQKNEEMESLKRRLQVVENQNEELVETLQELAHDKTKTGITEVLVEAQLPNLAHNIRLVPGQTVIFNKLIYNIGNAYDTSNGIFTAQRNGTYLFSASICTNEGHWLTFAVIKEHSIISECMVGDKYWETCGTRVAVVYLSAREHVWVKVLRAGGNSAQLSESNKYGISSFAATLLSTLNHA